MAPRTISSFQIVSFRSAVCGVGTLAPRLSLIVFLFFLLRDNIAMASQSGVQLESAGKPFKVVDNLPKSTPGPKEVLVKPLFVAINPV